jgi:hypothetical protein
VDSTRQGETSRPSHIGAALRVKDLALDLAGDLADGYRKSTRYTRMRGAVVASAVLLSLLLMWIAWPPSGDSRNSLGAQAVLSEGFLGDKSILLWNDSDEIWTDVTVTLDGKWEWKTSLLRPGEKQSLRPDEFTNFGTAAPRDLTPRSVEIDCRQGSATVSLAQGSP